MGHLAKCGFYAALFAVFLTVFYTGSSANAASDYDGAIRNTPQVSIINNHNGDVVNRDISNLYDEYITDTLYDNRWSGSLADRLESRAKYIEAKQSGYVSVSQSITKSTGKHEVTITYTTGNGNTEWISDPTHGAYVYATSDEKIYRLRIEISSYDGEFFIHQNQNNTVDMSISNDGTSSEYDIYVYESNYPIEYPEGYEGEEVGDSQGDVTYKPNITWEVDDYDVTFYSDHSKNTATLPPDYQIYWFFSNTTFDTVQPTEPFALSGCTDPAFVNEHTVPVYFDYGLQAYYADRDCNILSRDLNENVLIDQMVVLNVDGGTYSGSTETDSEYIEENKLVGAIKNISVDQHGLQSLVLAPAQLFAQVATWDGSCSTISMPFIQGKTLELQCIRSGFSTQYPVIYGTIQVVFGGLIAYFVAIRTFAVIKGANDPEDDKVETYKL